MGRNGLFTKPVVRSLQEYGRGIVGGLLFSLPLLYTMEVWYEAFITPPAALLAYMLIVLVLLLGYNRYAGMRRDVTWKEVLIDSIEETGLGIVLSFAILSLLNRIHSEMDIDEILSLVILEGMIFAIGISVGTAHLGGNNMEAQGKDGDEQKKNDKRSKLHNTLEFITLAACGAVLVGSNVGATMEIVVMGLETTPVQILILAIISVILAVGILYFLSFRGELELRQKVLFQISWTATTSFSIALVTAAFILWFFGRLDNTSFEAAINETVVLGFATILGASAGKLLIKGG